MSTSLSQVIGNAMPQLPGVTTLQIQATAEPAALLHDLGSDQSSFHCRLMINISQASGGELTVAGGLRADGRSVWQLVVDTDAQLVRLEIESAECQANLPTAIDWHCVEVALHSITGDVALRLNGIERDTTNTTLDPTRQAWIGGAFFSANLVGTVELDHWVLADQSIGVPQATPEYDHGADPRRWLVVYQRSDADSCAWAEAYRHRRGVPYGNLCGLDLPTSETITAGEFETMRQQINNYLDDNNLRQQIVGVLLGYKVPGYADVAGQGMLTPIASYLHTDDVHGLPSVNPLYQSTIAERPLAADYSNVRLTGRIDASSLAEALALIDRADNLVDQPLAFDTGADCLIDTNPDNVNVGPVYTQPVQDWVEDGGLSRLRLPFTVYDAQGLSEANNDAVVWGWRDAAPPAGFFASPAGRRAICMQFDPEPTPAVTLRNPLATDWLSTALQAGYAFAAAPSRAYSLSSLPLPHLFFGALRMGWSVAEAWLVAQPFVRDGLQLVGDPLMPIVFPKSGYDVFGPVSRLDQVDFDSPLAVLHAGERALMLQLSDLPGAGESSRYLVRRVDGQGRADNASAAAFVALEAGQPVRPAMPAWPDDEGWPVLRRDGRLILSAYWPASLRTQGIDSVQLSAQVTSEEPVSVDHVTPKAGQRRVVFSLATPTQSTRYRFAIVQGQATFFSPWSGYVSPPVAPTQSLTVLEAS